MEAVFYLNGCRMMAVTGLRLELITSGDGWRSYGHVYIQYQHAHIYGEQTRRDAVRERSWVKRTLATSLAHRKDKLQIDLRKTLSEGRGDSHRKHRKRTINTREVWKLKVLFIFTAHIKGRKSDADVALAMCEGGKKWPNVFMSTIWKISPSVHDWKRANVWRGEWVRTEGAGQNSVLQYSGVFMTDCVYPVSLGNLYLG